VSSSRGFTIAEVLVAVMVLAVGLLGLVGTGALVTRMIARGQRSAVAMNFATQRLERLRASGTPASVGCLTHTNGADTLFRGGRWVAINTWTWTDLGNDGWKIALAVTYRTARGATRTDNLVTEITCRG
jgi:prepilin-type N-terminal cleavage/methylation domain-containing protein